METVNDNKWMEKWEAVKEKTVCPVDLNTYFEQKEIAGKALAIMDIGACDLPSGKVLGEISPSPTCRLPVDSLSCQLRQTDPKVSLELS